MFKIEILYIDTGDLVNARTSIKESHILIVSYSSD